VRIIFKWILKEVGCGVVDSIQLAEERIWWWAVVVEVRTFGFHKRWGIS
jgi:hypothetical protein